MKCKIIAEAATNHLGQLSKAKDLVIAARDCGADYIKFQAWQCKNIKKPTKRDIECELSDSDLLALRNYADKVGIRFLVSIFDIGRISFIRDELGCNEIKIPSQDLTAWGLLKACHENFKFVYLSTGMSTQTEIYKAIDLFWGFTGADLCLMHCVSDYPCLPGNVNLSKIKCAHGVLDCFARGYSDHTRGVEVAKQAIAMGIYAYEGHFALKKYVADIFSQAAKSPNEMSDIVKWTEDCEIRKGKLNFGLTPHDREMRWEWKNYRGDNHGPAVMRSS